MVLEPDLAGYREAQIRLIENLGTTVPFFTPTNVAWPGDAAIDPESGVPFDPTIEPTSSGFTSAAVKCGVVLRPIGLSRRGIEDDSTSTALGFIEEGAGVLLVPKEDFDSNALASATRAEVHDEVYEITSSDPDGIGEVDHRVVVYIRQL